MRILFIFYFLVLPMLLFSQKKFSKEFDINSKYQSSTDTARAKKPQKVATIDMYRVITLERDTTYIDTSLTIQKEYSHNYLRKDIFGLLPFSNEGQTYAVLDYGLKAYSAFPEIGFSGKQFNFMGSQHLVIEFNFQTFLYGDYLFFFYQQL